ncbi:MAG TPA: HEAT repeat domain-containing protein [Planctomycetaceae bacterium]|nr:HEAT repeat domain-containing protein [Planctomycetaceae bacterium]
MFRGKVWLAAGLLCLFAGAATAHAADPELTPEEFKQVLERLSKVEKELAALKQQKPGEIPADPKQQRVLLLLETPYLGGAYYGAPNGPRFLAARLLVVNMTPDAIAGKRSDLKLTADGQDLELKEVPANIKYQSFQVSGQQLQMQSVQPPREFRIPSGGSGAIWLYFGDIAQGTHIPRMELTLKHGEKTHTLDINAAQRAVLGLDVNRTGPRDCLGMLTISGELNSISVGSLVDELDRLSAQKVGRAVISWTESASPMDNLMWNWLQASANAAGRSEAPQLQFPTIPASIRELHLAAAPLRNVDASSDGEEEDYSEEVEAPATPRIHKTEAEAVRAALKSAFETLPREELLAAIQTGNRHVRAAALACGAGRLPADKLPVVLRYCDDSDPVIQRGALQALQHFGEPEAIAKLAAVARKNVQPLSSTAVSSLAASRFAAAHEALLAILRNESPASKKAIVQVLAQHPRPAWSDAIYEFAKDPRSGLNIEALRALQKVGHPKLLELLSEALRDGDPELKQQAFTILVARTDPASERVAMDYTLDALKKGPPDATMLTLLNRVKDARAVPLLLEQFDKSNDKSSLIQALTQIGDQTTADALLSRYANLQTHEKAQILNALFKWKHRQARELAAEALASQDGSLISAATQGLVEDGGAEAVKLLVDGFEKAQQPQAWAFISNALAMLGTPAARAALIKARDSNPKERRQYAVNGLTQIRSRSPGYGYYMQAQQLVAAKDLKRALEQYNLAIQIDPELSEAYSGRASLHMRQNKMADARKDYEKAYDLDPYNVSAVTGICIVTAIDGKYTEAIEKLEASREKFVDNPYFLYDAACVYGRAIEYIKAHADVPEREQLLERYAKLALVDLKKSVRLGFRDFKWMKEDPDLKSLHDEPQFEKISNENQENENDNADAAEAAEG